MPDLNDFDLSNTLNVGDVVAGEFPLPETIVIGGLPGVQIQTDFMPDQGIDLSNPPPVRKREDVRYPGD